MSLLDSELLIFILRLFGLGKNSTLTNDFRWNQVSLPIIFISMQGITVIIPVYNEEGNIFRIKEALGAYMERSNYQVFGLFVNDGSTDQSLSLIKEVCVSDKKFGYISLQHNAGLSAAIKAGFDQASTQWVGYMDADLQTSPLDFLLFEPYVSAYHLVTGERQQRQDGLGKKFSSLFANWFRNSFLQDGVNDTGCPLKIFDREFVIGLPYFNGVHRFFPALTQIYGGQVKVIPVGHYPRLEGVSKFNAFNRLIQPFLDTLLVHRLKKRFIKYKVKEAQLFDQSK